MLRIGLMALAAALIAGVAITLILLKFYKTRVDNIKENITRPGDLSDWDDWKHDEWSDAWRDEWNDWELWDRKKETEN